MDHQTIPLGIWFSSWTYITVHSFVKAQKMAYLPVVPHKAVAEVSKIGNLCDRLVCCESRMAQRIHWWTERWLRSPLFLSLSLTTYLPTYLPTCLSIYLSIFMAQLVHNAPTRRALLENKRNITNHATTSQSQLIGQWTSWFFFLSFLILPFDTTHFLFLGDKSSEFIIHPYASLRICAIPTRHRLHPCIEKRSPPHR